MSLEVQLCLPILHDWRPINMPPRIKALQRVVKTVERIIGSHLPSVQGIYNTRCLRKARNIIKDHSHPDYGILTLLPSGRRYQSIQARTTRLTNSVFPQAVRLLNQQH